ncbi:hypothetical protein ABTX62_06585 [Streptomyces sp. NPDC096046]|uniref:SPW repeat domain-containing protein n=1 Tax=Streptomyces sp. NPDC096046 TaxID=3155542 RepID=UPI00332D5308
MRDHSDGSSVHARRVSRAESAGTLRAFLISVVLLLVAVWLFLAGWVLDYPPGDPTSDARLNEILVCVLVFLTAATRLVRTPGIPSDLLLTAAGAWLVGAPFALGYGDTSMTEVARFNDVASGGLIVLLALVSLAALPVARSRTSPAA